MPFTCYLPDPIFIPSGKAVKMSELRYGNKFQYYGYQGIHSVIGHDPLKVKRPDGWLTKPRDMDKVVYLV